MTTATPGGAMPPSAKRPTATHARHRRTSGTARAALQTRAMLHADRTAHTTLRTTDITLRPLRADLQARALLHTDRAVHTTLRAADITLRPLRAALQARALLHTDRAIHTTLRAADIALRSPGVPLRAMLYTTLRPSGMVR